MYIYTHQKYVIHKHSILQIHPRNTKCRLPQIKSKFFISFHFISFHFIHLKVLLYQNIQMYTLYLNTLKQ